MNDKKLEYTYCKKMLAYDIYGKDLYKIETDKAGGYESTLDVHVNFGKEVDLSGKILTKKG